MRFTASLALLALVGFGLTAAAAADGALPRLTGIVVGPLKRVAIFVDRKDAHAVSSVEEGGEIAGFRIVKIKFDEVVLEGPSGTARLALEQDVGALTWRAAPPPDPTILQETTKKNGAAMGLLAIQRDRCARAGLLPGVGADAEEKMRRLIVAISDLPGPTGGGGAHPHLLASALDAGLNAARRPETSAELDAAACEKVNANWQADAGRYGMP